jgi:hypothetical protein
LETSRANGRIVRWGCRYATGFTGEWLWWVDEFVSCLERRWAMATPRRKISKPERKERDALMRVINLVLVMVIRRLFDDGWTTEQVALAYGQIQNETGRIAIDNASPDWQYVDDTKVAEAVYAAVKAGQ